MCKAIEDLLEEVRLETQREIILEEHRKLAIDMIKKEKFSFEDIADLCKLTIEEVEELARKKSA